MRRFGFIVALAVAALALWWLYSTDVSRDTGMSGTGHAPQKILRRGNGQEPESLDPHKAQTDSSQKIVRDLFEGLTILAPDGSIAPGTAESWSISDDGTVYTFVLRENARWSDGSSVKAQDFVFAFRRLVTPATASPYAQMLAQVENARDIIAGAKLPETLGVSASDDRTLVIRLHTATPYFLGLLANSSTSPIHHESLLKHGKQFVQPGNMISNGAFVLDERVVGSHVAVTRNPYYWNNNNTSFDKVYFQNITDATSEFQRYRAGDLAITYTIPQARTAWLMENMRDELKIAPYLGIYYYALNITKPPFRDNAVLREALSLAIDRDFITEKITAAGQLPAYGWIPPGVENYTSQYLAYGDQTQAERVARAQELFEQAGYSKDQPLEIEIRYNTGTAHQQIAVAIASMWKEHLGVESTLVNEEFRVLIENAKQRVDTQVVRSSWLGDYNDAYSFAEILRSDHSINYAGYASDDYDRLLDLAASESDAARRRDLLQQAERHMLAEHPIIPIYFYVSRHLVKPRVTGWHGNIMDYHYSKDLGLRE